MEKNSISAEDRLFAALAYPYWYVAFPVYLLSNRYQNRPFLRYHLFHALFLGLAILWGGVLLWTTAAVVGKFGAFGILLYPFLKLAEWVAFLTTVYATLMAFAGQRVTLPLITDLARPYLVEKGSQSSSDVR